MITNAAIYLAAHLLLYSIWLRHLKAFSTERGIFLYHAVPAVVGALILGLGVALSVIAPAWLILLLGIHCVYSLTFLELWALADGGYSLSILDCLDGNTNLDQQRLLNELAKLGTAKEHGRVSDLLHNKLIVLDGDHYALTPAGRRLALGFRAIIRLANVHVRA